MSFTTRRPDQPFQGNMIPRRPHRLGGAQHPDPALSGAEHARHPAVQQRTDDQQLSAQPDQAPRGQPVRRQGRPQPDEREPLLHEVQLREDASDPAGEPPARGCRVHVRRWRGKHQGPEPGLQRHAHPAAEPPERVPLRLVLDQVLPGPDRLRHKPGRGRGPPRRQSQSGHLWNVADDVSEHQGPGRQR